MATSVITSDHHHHPNMPLSPQTQETHHPTRRGSGRRRGAHNRNLDSSSSSGRKKNKEPQRGMGVEKLERLILQDRWKKMTEVTPPTPVVSFKPAPVRHLGSGFGSPGHDPGYVQYGPKMDVFNVKCYSEHCNACHKKKKVSGENLGRVRSSEMYHHVQMCNVVGSSDCGFLGLNNIGEYHQNHVVSQENQQYGLFGTRPPMVPVGKQGVEIVAVHRKGSSSSECVMMEYEFFPSAKKSDSHSDDQLVMMNLADQTTPYSSSSSPSMLQPGFDHASSNCVDLSLKL